jgi:hypothetical protein
MALDLSTVKGESSTEYGESLLGALRTSNEADARQAKKKADKAAKLQIGFGIAEGMGDYVTNKNTQNFLNSTEVVGKNLATKIALQNHTDITSAEKNAQAFEGGYNAYFSAQGEARVKVELDSKFGSGYYNQATYNALLKSRGAKVGRLLLDAHTTRLDASNTYLAQSGGEKTYNDIIKDTRETTIKGKISSYLGSVTGLTSDDEIAQSAEDLFDSATELNRFNSIYNDTKNGTVSVLLAKELPDELGVPTAVIGELQSRKEKDVFGVETETFFHESRIVNEKGETIVTIVDVTNGTVNTKQSDKDKNTYISRVAVAENTPALVSLGGEIIRTNLSPKDLEVYNTSVDDLIKSSKFSSLETKEKSEARARVEANFKARIAVNTLQLQNQLGISQIRAGQLAIEMFSLDPALTGGGLGKKGAGKYSPYLTIMAMANTDASGTSIYSADSVNAIYGTNGINLAHAWENSSRIEREQITSMLNDAVAAGNQNFNPLIQAHRVVIEAQSIMQSTGVSREKATAQARLNLKNNAIARAEQEKKNLTKREEEAKAAAQKKEEIEAVTVPVVTPRSQSGVSGISVPSAQGTATRIRRQALTAMTDAEKETYKKSKTYPSRIRQMIASGEIK